MKIEESFHVNFHIEDYKAIAPDVHEYLKYDRLLNAEPFKKGDLHLCVWKNTIQAVKK